ncbi:mechanosensitive ion channel family protein [Oleispirillum naphthae]|uniref:mechanosensitive ion channel family protein n=1 Tax=Oleispirillum naphthae TaxID=2838853 RepID=UPI0030826201
MHSVPTTAVPRRTPVFLAAACVAFLAVFLAAPVGAARAADAPPPAVSEPAAPRDALGRDTPEGFVRGLVKAMAEQDFARAAQYLDLSGISQSRRAARGEETARNLLKMLDEGGWLATKWQLSDKPQGSLDDGLAPDLERFATVRTPKGNVDLFAQRVKGPDGAPIWLVSARTVTAIPGLLAHVDTGLIERIIPEWLKAGPRILGAPLVQWAALLAFAIASYAAAWILTALASFGLHAVWRRREQSLRVRLVEAAMPPLRICLAVWLFALGGLYLGVAVVARQVFGLAAEVVGWVGLGWFLWRIADALGAAGIEAISQRNQWEALSAIRFFRRAAKFLVIAAVAIVVLHTLGFNVSAGLAALGIGGIAVALGAQKTVENLIGSLTLIADHPVREGDFCRFGNGTLGLVEEIGMRSTRIRTLDRTVITVPNGEFSALQIENFAVRDKFWFHPTLSLRYETTPDQMRYLLVELRAMLYGHPRVDPDPARVRFTGLGADSLSIEIFAYIDTVEINEFLEIQEDLTLRIMDIVAASGASFAFPSQTVYMAKDEEPDTEKRRAVEEKVKAWREAGEMQLPSFTPERIDALRGSIPYPPEGSVRGGSAAAAAEEDAPPPPPHQSVREKDAVYRFLRRLGIRRS